LTLDATEFLRRFVQHVLPNGFVKMRHYGLLANRRREERLAACRRLLFADAAESLTSNGSTAVVLPAELPRCPHCGGERFIYRELARELLPLPAPPARDDTS